MKNIKYLLIACLLFLVGIVTSEASSLVDGKYLTLCTYRNQYYDTTASANRTYNVYLLYNVKNNQFGVGESSDANEFSSKLDVVEGPLEGLANIKYFDPHIIINKDNFVCPKQGYYDLGGGLSRQHCFSNNSDYCKSKEGAGVRYVEASQQQRIYNFTDTINSYFKNWSIGDISLDDIIAGKYKTADDVIQKMNNDFEEVYLEGNKIPTFISNSNAYKNAVQSVKENFDDMKTKWEKEIAEKEANGELSKEEADDIRDNLNDIGGSIENDLKNSLNKGTGARLDSNNEIDTNLTFCKGNKGVLTVFRAFGYMLFIAKLLIPLILIILGSIDLAKAVLNSNEKPNKEVLMTFGKRLFAALIVFIIPTILDFGLSLVDGTLDAMENSKTNVSYCTKCLFDPLGDECEVPKN